MKQMGKQVSEEIIRHYANVAFHLLVKDQSRGYRGFVLSSSPPSLVRESERVFVRCHGCRTPADDAVSVCRRNNFARIN